MNYEYKITINSVDEDKLDAVAKSMKKLGKQGWELVAVTNRVYDVQMYWKRPL